MKKFKLSLIIITLVAFCVQPSNAQDADEIIANYLENTGGIDAWKSLKGVRITAKVNQGGIEIPLNIYQFADGRQMTSFTFQGQTLKQGVYDGETLWGINFMTMKSEKSDAEATANMKLEANDFPDPFIDYKDKGYAVELLGKETIEGTETFKIKLTKEPQTVDGEKVDDVNYYYFDAEAFIPLIVESQIKQGPQKGAIGQTKFSDYQEVEGLYFPFSMTQGVKDGPSQPIIIDAIELNPTLDDSELIFDGEQ